MRFTKTVSLLLLFSLFICLCGCGAVPVQSAPAEPAETPAPSRVILPEEAKSVMSSGEEYLLLDVRDIAEYETGHIPGAVCIPYIELEARKDELPDDLGSTVLVYCRSGRRSAIAAQTLVSLGYTNVLDFGGIIDWPYETSESENAAASSCEHEWETLDCSYERCVKCGWQRNYE